MTITQGFTIDMEPATAAFLAVRDRLIGIAYRILRSCTWAEDIVHDGWAMADV